MRTPSEVLRNCTSAGIERPPATLYQSLEEEILARAHEIVILGPNLRRKESSMPSMQAMVERSNSKFNREHIGEFNADWLGPGVPLAEGAQSAGIAVADEEVQYLQALPAGHQAVIKAALYSAVTRG